MRLKMSLNLVRRWIKAFYYTLITFDLDRFGLCIHVYLEEAKFLQTEIWCLNCGHPR